MKIDISDNVVDAVLIEGLQGIVKNEMPAFYVTQEDEKYYQRLKYCAEFLISYLKCDCSEPDPNDEELAQANAIIDDLVAIIVRQRQALDSIHSIVKDMRNPERASGPAGDKGRVRILEKLDANRGPFS